MTTKELIEIANKCCNGICFGAGYECPYFDRMDCQRDLIKRLADMLEKAYHDLTRFAECDVDCITCKYCNTKCPENREYKWRGDDE